MNLRETAGRLNRIQHTRGFKLVATGVILALTLILVVGAIVQANRPPTELAQAAGAAAQIDQAEIDPGESISNSGAAQRMARVER